MYRKIPTQQSLFDRYLAFVAKQELMMLVVLASLAGLAVFFSGILAEMNTDTRLLAQGGQAAQAAYLMGLQLNPVDSVPEFLRLGILGRLPSSGGNQQAVGITIIFVGSAVAILMVFVARAYLAVSERVVYRLADRIQ